MTSGRPLTPQQRDQIRRLAGERGPEGRRRYTQATIARRLGLCTRTIQRVSGRTVLTRLPGGG